MTRSSGGVADVSRMCVRVGSIPPVLFCIHALCTWDHSLLVVDWTCHDSQVTIVSLTDATQGNCVCSSAPLFLISFFLFPHFKADLNCRCSSNLPAAEMKACHHQEGKCEDCSRYYLGVGQPASSIYDQGPWMPGGLTKQSAMSGFTSASTHFTSALTALALALALSLSRSLRSRALSALALSPLSRSLRSLRSLALSALSLSHSYTPPPHWAPARFHSWPEVGFPLQAKEKKLFAFRKYMGRRAGTGTTWGTLCVHIGSSHIEPVVILPPLSPLG
ncbi:hypothetical protein Pelo_4534 [Pelomyxa schiedti]|nr:hypothetical protein Pelo_4534 [Pelomyxa schiedti]